MATIATDVQWGSSPKIYFDFSYEKKRDGSTQYYRITVSCDPVTGASYFGYPIYLQIYLDGTSKATQTLKAASPSQWGSAISYTSGWLAVSNKTSGTTALAIRVYSGMGSTRDTTYNYSLNIDPAASAISCTTANVESHPTITISKADPNFTHTITYSFGTLSGTIVEKTNATRITDWTIPEEFYTQIPDAKTGWGSLYCTTYNGNTELGTTRCDLNVGTDETKCKPIIQCLVSDINDATVILTGRPDRLVRYCSTAECSIHAYPQKGASGITEQTVNNVATSAKLVIENVETGTFDFYAKDSRGYFNTEKVVYPIVPYIILTADVTGFRNDPTSGNATIQVKGNYFNGSFGTWDNALTISYRQGDASIAVTPTITDNTYSATIELTGLDYTKAFNFEVKVADMVNTVTKKVTIQKGIPVFDWGEEDFRFNVPVTINGVNILEKLAELESRIS